MVRINVTSAPIAHYVLFCNAVAVYFRSHTGYFTIILFALTSYWYINLLRAFFTLNAIWSFDPLYFVSPALCLSPQIEDIHVAYIDTLATLYPFLLLMLTYTLIELHARDYRPIVTLWRPFHRTLVRLRSISSASLCQPVLYIIYKALVLGIFSFC